MYHFYHTPGFVLATQDISEGSRMLSIFTRELGFVRVHARSLREERSKLRGFLQPFSFAQVTLIRGRDMWRLTTASIGDETTGGSLSWFQRRSLAYVSQVLERHLQGEEGDSALYDVFRDGVQYLPRCAADQLGSWESLILARLLSQLGYGNIEHIDEMLVINSWDEKTVLESSRHEQALSALVQRAFSASQL